MRRPVIECFFQRAISAFLLSSLISTEAVFPDLMAEHFDEFVVVPENPVVFILDGNRAGDQIKQASGKIQMTIK